MIKRISRLGDLWGPTKVGSDHLHHHVDLGQWDVDADAINKRTKAFSRVVKGQGRATLKALVPAQQRGGDETCHMGLFADVHPTYNVSWSNIGMAWRSRGAAADG